MTLNPPPRYDDEWKRFQDRLEADEHWEIPHLPEKPSGWQRYIVPGLTLFVGISLLLLASWRAGLVLSYPDRLWHINGPAMLGLVFMLVGFLGIFWVNWKER